MSDFAEFPMLHECREGLNLVCVAIPKAMLRRTPVFGKSHIYTYMTSVSSQVMIDIQVRQLTNPTRMLVHFSTL